MEPTCFAGGLFGHKRRVKQDTNAGDDFTVQHKKTSKNKENETL